jgi:hypothetical protein
MLAFAEDPKVQSSALAANLRRLVLAVAILVTWGVASRPALAADPKAEKEAQALQKKAIEEDYLNVDYAAAVKNLKAAAQRCGADGCKPTVKAAILRDLGSMQILGGTIDEGKLSYTQSLGLDSTLDLDPAYKNPQLTALWTDAKKSAAPAPTPTPTPAPTVEAPPPPTSAGGDFNHTPPVEALVRTPLTIYAEYPGTEELVHVIAKYKGFGMTEWKSIELRKLDHGFGGAIPCADVAQGPMQYYLQGVNAQNEPVAASGSRTKPITVAVNAQIAGAPAGLPGEPAPAQCEDKSGSECPPDFPGCKSGKKAPGADCAKGIECEAGTCTDGKCAELKEAGESCESESECESGSCSDGKCVSKKSEGEDCESSDECDSNKCKNGKCAASAALFRRVWLGAGVQADWYIMPAGANVCAVPGVTNGPSYEQPIVSTSTSTGYSCVDSSGNRFPPTDPTNGPLVDHDIAPSHDRVTAGPAFGNVRILASIDYALNSSMLVGLRAGYVLRTDPLSGTLGSPFPPIHIEARFTYLIGKDPLMATGVAPMVFAGIGAGEFDAYVPVKIDLNAPAAMHVPAAPYNAATPVGQPITVNAWQTAGPIFISAGGGARFAFTTSVAMTAAVRLEGAFGGTAGSLWGFAPELGVQFGL